MRTFHQRILQSVLMLSFVGFIVFQFNGSLAANSADRYLNLQLFAKVLNLVQKYYVDEVDSKKLIYGGIKGMLQELDPHTNFLPPDIYKEFESETSGKFGGLGIEITVQDGILTIISPIEDTPAWKAGLKAGDKIVSINGASTKGLSLAEAAQKMRGRTGTKIKLGIVREGLKDKKDYSITRGVIKIKSVKFTDLGDGYGYLRLTSFIENSAKEVKRVLGKIKKNHGEIKGVILDLRLNPGGLLDQAIKISDYFMEKGTIVSTIGRDKEKKKVVEATPAGGKMTDFPIVVLINEFSASASEIVAGALKDNKRALVMGKRSFGKGSVQSVVKMGDGSGLKMTVARYYTPAGISIQAEGITPDVEVDEVDSEAFKKAIIKRQVRRESDISGHLLSEKEERKKKKQSIFNWWVKTDKKSKKNKNSKEKLLSDFQVLQAYNYLKAYKVMKNL